MGRSLTDQDLCAQQDALLGWAAPRLRDFAWRTTRDPWAVLVSEVMLQQTGVGRVIPKWNAFMEAFPSPRVCATSSLGDVLRLWQGLGYPRRARNLHAAAGLITREHGGQVPDSLDSLLGLPGVGAYTARAVLAFAFEHDVAVVDTNVARVLARLSGERLTPKRAQSDADELLAEGAAWLWNQAFMDLGATVCRPVPSCGECPWFEFCAWRGQGDDPAVGSAGVSVAQSRFEGSDRQARGRLIKVLGEGSVRMKDVPRVMDRPRDVANRLVKALTDEGLVSLDPSNSTLQLP